MITKSKAISVVVAGCGLLASGVALAQFAPAPDAEGTRGAPASPGASLPFDFQPPGARALALGGAFAAVADDATAAEANPAGMTILVKPEVSLHLRRSSYDIPTSNVDYLDILGDPLDPFASPRYKGSKNSIAFASVVYPLEWGSIGVFYQNSGDFARQDFRTTFEDNFFLDNYEFNRSLGAELESVGFSIAYRFNDMVSLGASVKRSKLSLVSIEGSRVDYYRDFEVDLANALGGQPSDYIGRFNDFFDVELSTKGDDADIAYNIGLLLNPNGAWSASVVYRDNGRYDLDFSSRIRNAFNCGTVAECSGGFDIVTESPVNSRTVRLPNVLSLGFAWRPSDTWLVALQADRSSYSVLGTPRGESLVFSDTSADNTAGSSTPFLTESIESGWTPRIGVEKSFPMAGDGAMGLSVFSLRAGAFRVPDHDGLPQIDTRSTHKTIGFGAAFANGLQIDFAGDFSDTLDTLMLSTVYRF